MQAKSQYSNLYRLGIISKEANNGYNRNKVQKIISTIKDSYYIDLFHLNQQNVRKIQNIINNLVNCKHSNETIKFIISNIYNGEITNNSNIAEIFNNYFCNIGTELNSNLPTINKSPDEYVEFKPKSLLLSHVTDFEYEQMISFLKKTKHSI